MKVLSKVWLFIAVQTIVLMPCPKQAVSAAGSAGPVAKSVLAASFSESAIIPAEQGSPDQVESLIQQAREQGINYLQSRDDKARSSAKKNLEQAEKTLKEQLKREPNCEKCVQNLTATHFYRTYFGFSKSYDDCIKMATSGLARFPNNAVIAFYKGFAHYNSMQYRDAARAFSRYLASTSAGDPAAAQARQLLQDSQQHFLSEWNMHSNFYQLSESRIEAYNPQTFQKEIIFQVTPDFEVNLGSQAFAQFAAAGAQTQDPEVQSYLEMLVSNLVSKSPGPNFNYTVTVLDSQEVNAFTVPGHIFVYSGLLRACQNEAELAAVLGHELAHNYAHHSARLLINQYYMQSIAANIAQAINPRGQVAQTIAQLASNLGVNLFLRAYSRSEEKEADLYGTHIMFNAGYNPTAMSSFQLTLYKLYPKQPVKLFSTHPPSPDRVQYLTDYLESFPLDREMQMDSQAFQKMKARIATSSPAQQQKGPGKGVVPLP